MKSKEYKFSIAKVFAIFVSAMLLSACGGETDTPTETIETPDINYCNDATEGVNWNALLNNTCPNLSDYNLFSDPTDPTTNPTVGGIPYDLSTALFTDYATKYRYVFIQNGKSATYSDNEVMDFPVGSVLVKTFSLPDNTSDRTGTETIIETRLLIHREGGWKALPYYWEESSDAKFLIVGKSIPSNITHDNSILSFNYVIPKAAECVECHAVVPMLQDENDVRPSIFKPIGPKARFLNNNYNYLTGPENQLTFWEDAGILTGAPVTKTGIDTASEFHDATTIAASKANIDALTSSELASAARSYLDINCAHCHRSELSLTEPLYEGAAGDSGLRLEFNRTFTSTSTDFGICKTALAGGGGIGHDEHPRDIIPGHSEASYLPYRMNSLDGSHKMPELGRSTIHTEGVYLISKWIDDMAENTCGFTLPLVP